MLVQPESKGNLTASTRAAGDRRGAAPPHSRSCNIPFPAVFPVWAWSLPLQEGCSSILRTPSWQTTASEKPLELTSPSGTGRHIWTVLPRTFQLCASTGTASIMPQHLLSSARGPLGAQLSSQGMVLARHNSKTILWQLLFEA